MSNSIKIVNDKDKGKGLRISGSIILNSGDDGDIPVIGSSLLERPLYSSEISGALKNEVFEEHKEEKNDNLVEVIGDKKIQLTDTRVSPKDENYYRSIELEKTLYSSSKMVVDIINDSITVDLIEDDQYTNYVDLLRVEKKTILPGLSAIVNLSIKYSKGENIFGEDLLFKAFSYDNDLNVIRENFISPLGEVVVEYIEGIIRVVPSSLEVGECIISNCAITYGCKKS